MDDTVISPERKTAVRLIFERGEGSLGDAWRPYNLVVDGCACGALPAGSAIALDVRPGDHTIHFEVDPQSYKTVRLSVGQEPILISCASSSRSWLRFFSALPAESWISVKVKEGIKIAPIASAHHIAPQPMRDEMPPKLVELIAQAAARRRARAIRV
jgi:hypothetical protein